MESLETIKEKVSWLLDRYPESRSNDRFLIASYMRKYHRIITFRQYYSDPKCPTTESIRRVRQKIQAKGLFVSTNETVN